MSVLSKMIEHKRSKLRLPLPSLVLAEARLIAEEQPNTVYTRSDESKFCSYDPDSENDCGCIVGYAMRRVADRHPGYHDLDKASAKLMTGDETGYLNSRIGEIYGRATTIDFQSDRVEMDALALLGVIQHRQDMNVHWDGLFEGLSS